MGKEANDIETFFVYGVLGVISIIVGFILLLKSFSGNGAFALFGIIFLVLGLYLKFKYKIRKNVVHIRK